MGIGTTLFAAFCTSFAYAQDLPVWEGYGKNEGQYGKSEREIVAMGRNRWTDYHAERAGQTTVAMVEGQIVWYNALTSRNNELLARRTPESRRKLLELDRWLEKFRLASLQAGMAYSGGGTMWQIFGASALADRADLMHSLLTGTGTPGKPYKVSEGSKAIGELRSLIQRARSEGDSYRDLDEASRHAAKMGEIYPRIVRIAATMPRKSSDLILEFCVRRAKVAIDF